MAGMERLNTTRVATGRGRETRRQRIAAGIAPCLERATLRRTGPIAVSVGCILTLINEGDVLLAGHATPRVGVKIVLNFCVPFLVSNLGVIAGRRTAAGTRSPPQGAAERSAQAERNAARTDSSGGSPLEPDSVR
jgi:hypothetical protein